MPSKSADIEDSSKKSTRLTRSSSKKLAVAENLGMKKTRVQLNFDDLKTPTNSPALKKVRASTLTNSGLKTRSKDKTLESAVQNLLNVAAKCNSTNICLSYLELPKLDAKKFTDSKGNVRAAVPKQLEGIPNIDLQRPIIWKTTNLAGSIKLPEAPSFLMQNTVPAQLSHQKNMLKYLIIIDFESTCWEDRVGNSLPPPEVIEFPAVLVNLQTGVIEDRFQQYVMPMEEPKLSDFCQKFTGITQQQVDAGIPLSVSLKLFLSWVDAVVAQREMVAFEGSSLSNLNHPKTAFFSIATWTDWDLKLCLNNECSRKSINFPTLLKRWIDLKSAFRQNYGWTPKGLKGALEDLGLTFEGREHSGLNDAINTARLSYRMVCDGSVFDQFSEI
ncbi:ERI1 exoribonuclease 2-like [Neocloeon triangulifer]|uniref:ERI1 exoribonuclease 2-like n=1 Tax=Neocloeon triangulifer TaxID=2078957 RepID=UPI00286F03AA|nr:ERI1 exoribonuclease 2-like [Neocloeon triangulifer]